MREDPAKVALTRNPPTPDTDTLRVEVHLSRLDFAKLNTARRRGQIGRQAFDRLIMGLGVQVLEAIVADEAVV